MRHRTPTNMAANMRLYPTNEDIASTCNCPLDVKEAFLNLREAISAGEDVGVLSIFDMDRQCYRYTVAKFNGVVVEDIYAELFSE